MESKQSPTASASGPASRLLPWLPLTAGCKSQINLFLSKMLLTVVFGHSHRNTKTEPNGHYVKPCQKRREQEKT